MNASETHIQTAHLNSLAHETSPYLLQHAHDPVDWLPWGDAAFEKARAEDKPVFLSIGYSSCHWCHVMAHESFSDEETAQLLNAHFVPVKVDREERPDLDEIYMAAVQVLTMSGGWPMSVFLTPDAKPFYGGSYFPREDQPGRIGFKTLLRRIVASWQSRRADVNADAQAISEAVRAHLARARSEPAGELNHTLLQNAALGLYEQLDKKHGGFHHRPKFPPENSLLFLLELQREDPGDAALCKMITLTLDQMSLGGIRDHLGGGFHRYSTDEFWLVPHFEKMLCDNALLARCYAEAEVLYKHDAYGHVAREAFDWILREMASPEGAFYSAQDADSEGEEGKFYVWSRSEIEQILGSDAGLFCELFNVCAHGNFREEASGRETGLNILHLSEPLGLHAVRLNVDEAELRRQVNGAKARLREARGKRVRPLRDDKVLTSWNALAISAFSRGAVLLKEPRYLEAALRAAEFLLNNLRTPEKRWLAVHRQGHSRLPAYLDDHAFLAVAFLDLAEASGDQRWRDEAATVIRVLSEHFADEKDGGFFFTADDHETLLARVKDPLDKAVPSGNGWAMQALVRLAELTGEERYRDRAVRGLKCFQSYCERLPEAMAGTLQALALHLKALHEKNGAPRPPEESAMQVVTRGPVLAELFVGLSGLRPGEHVPVAVVLTLDQSWCLHALPLGEEPPDPAALRLELLSPKLGALTIVRQPDPVSLRFPYVEKPISVYRERAVIGALLRVSVHAARGRYLLKVKVHFQACGGHFCEEPAEVVLSVPVEVVGPETEVHNTAETVFEPLGLTVS